MNPPYLPLSDAPERHSGHLLRRAGPGVSAFHDRQPITVEQSHAAANHRQAAFRRSQSEPTKTSFPPKKVSEVSLNMNVSLLH